MSLERRFKVTSPTRPVLVPPTFDALPTARLKAKAEATAPDGIVSEVWDDYLGKRLVRFTPDATRPFGWREERFE